MWVYPVILLNGPVSMGGLAFTDLGRDWIVCDPCSAIIETEDIIELEKQSLQAALHNMPKGIRDNTYELYIKRIVEGMHSLFWSRRCGPRYLVRHTH
jgi:hypothetical protein